jgi:hypothetical protein
MGKFLYKYRERASESKNWNIGKDKKFAVVSENIESNK